MNDYFAQVVGQLKLPRLSLSGAGQWRYEVWKRYSMHLTVPNRCASRLAANAVMKAAGIRHRF